ncbi:hypothetical protein ASPWEDRAFT_176499 [Aspergillus wentii DTO 134E9]|uniref:Invertebrate defensins family profile domain-containing protein n=1 Tax=Aspergillus wentii DTO 134E9 TaxID=1073089 RepID=A0A1L9R926_ASPWE|nr:uncharacterized protein ASPWEDRAFT_176499 [Aspergillus wentii DTO 134E9]KAI9926529.1 hypothetical protein MW887_004297 [Aspergillus wentii]OJJ31424.1 hypothetical protein ASPWEDRAFT_176499 [Aspergillus wentii DTO 134E9]
MRFSIASLSLFLAVIGSAAAMPAAEPTEQIDQTDQLARRASCGMAYSGLSNCKKYCGGGTCHVIALGPLHKCNC